MRWNIIVDCVGEDCQQSTITLAAIERLAASTTAENLGINLRESKQIANLLQDAVVKQQRNSCRIIVNKVGNVPLVASSDRSMTSAADGWTPSWEPSASWFRNTDIASAAAIRRFATRFRKSGVPNVAVTSGGSSRLVVVQSANTVHIPQSEETH
jgi:hypothetical protein